MRNDTHFLPFLWVHGEEHDVYRKMVRAVYDANIRQFCVEARPHEGFAGPQWWDDMEVILSEAEKLGMRVWILDDKHFPTGYANGGVLKAPVALHRQHICHRRKRVAGGKTIRLNLTRMIRPDNDYDWKSWVLLLYTNKMRLPKKYGDDVLLSCSAWRAGGKCVDLSPYISGNTLKWDAPDGDWTVEVCSLSRDTGMHRSYINMIDKDSCRIQIDEVYEPHYEHFKERFGSTIAGFFSDEPELGNGNYIRHGNVLGTNQSLPYSRELADMLHDRLGEDWKTRLPLLWINDGDPAQTAQVRLTYMDCLTALVEECFSKQLGLWCQERGVEYIGHVIEDNNQHARTSTSLGHFFRGLKWQTMSGIDDIGGQVYPGGEDRKELTILGFIADGEFYHYALGKLGTSLGALNPRMSGRTMCEIFGNYGWSEGVRLEKYLLDHFMVRGVNYFVPHAFTCKPYPDKDCPPHFYAHGNNPQYRHFGALMQYGERVCSLISGGRIEAPVAILYHAEAEWSGECMLMQKPARVLWDNQVDFNFVPGDVFSEREFYKTEIGGELVINGRPHKLLIIPYSQFITADVAQGIAELTNGRCRVVFIDKLPQGLCSREAMARGLCSQAESEQGLCSRDSETLQGLCSQAALPDAVSRCDVVSLDHLMAYIDELGLRDVTLSPGSDRLRCMHYIGDRELFYLFNEGSDTYSGVVELPASGPLYEYDAWNDRNLCVEYVSGAGKCSVTASIEPCKSMLIMVGAPPSDCRLQVNPSPVIAATEPQSHEIYKFTQSVCRSIDYPNFTKHREINSLTSYSDTDKNFSGYIRYETTFNLDEFKQVELEITDAYEGVEVFVNGVSAGIKIVPTFVFDITTCCRKGQNELIIEVATTLERERGKLKKATPTGITGVVRLNWA